MTKPVLHQVTIGTAVGDAITNHVFLIRQWLREMGFTSEIFAEHVHPDLEKEVRPVARYRPSAREQWLIYHHSIGSAVVEQLLALPVRLILIYHNITPPEFFTNVDPRLAQEMVLGREQLILLRDRTDLALGVSPYNTQDLRQVGFSQTGVLPLALDESQYNLPSNPTVTACFEGAGPLLLFVGRQVPNKKQEDLIKLLYFYRRIERKAGLILVGGGWLPAYEHWLRGLACDLGLEGNVFFMGHVSQQDMVTCYRQADLYVSMSEHEGFGMPFVESMYLDLPILAYAAGGIRDTLGRVGVLFQHKNYEALAELVDLLIHDTDLRQRLITRQRERVQAFLGPRVRQNWVDLLTTTLSI